jgi:hypothetical protein
MRPSSADNILTSATAARPRPRRRGGLLLPMIASLALGGGLVLLAETAPQSAPQMALAPAAGVAAVPIPPPAWTDVVRPIQLFDIETPELAKLAQSYTERRHQTGGGRQDVLTFGTPDAAAYLRLTVYREGSEATAPAPFFVDMARRAAEAGLSVAKSQPPQAQATRFGSFEMAELTLLRDATPTAPCLGFRMSAPAAHLQMSGLACGTPARSPEALGCVLEHLDMAAAGDDRALIGYFADSELHRNPACLGGKLMPTPVHASWLDEKPASLPEIRKWKVRR